MTLSADEGHQLRVSSSNEAQSKVEMEFDQSRQFDLVWHVVVPVSKIRGSKELNRDPEV